MRKTTIFILGLVFLLISPFSISSGLNVCGNLTTDAYGTVGGIVANGTLGFYISDNSKNNISYFTPAGVNSFNITAHTRNLGGIAINISSPSREIIWLFAEGPDTILKINSAGTLIGNISISSLGDWDIQHFATFDGNTFYAFNTSEGTQINSTIYEFTSNFSTLRLCQTDFSVTDGISLMSPRYSSTGVIGFYLYSANINTIYVTDKSCKLVSTAHFDIHPYNGWDHMTSNGTSQIWFTDTGQNVIFNITQDNIPPRIGGLLVNDSFIENGGSSNVTFSVTDNCELNYSKLSVNVTGSFKNITDNSRNFTLHAYGPSSVEYGIAYTNSTFCGNHIGFQISVWDMAGNTNISTTNFTSVGPAIYSYQSNGTGGYNCSSTSLTNITYSFNGVDWVNFTINLSKAPFGGNFSCPYSSTGNSITNISNLSTACKIQIINRFTNGSSQVNIRAEINLDISTGKNLPLGIAAASIAVLIISVFIERTRRN